MGIMDERAAAAAAKEARYENRVKRAKAMKDLGYSNVLIARELGLNESTVRSLLEDKS